MLYGNQEVTSMLIKAAVKNGGWNVTEHFATVVDHLNKNKLDEKVKAIKKVNLMKKAQGLGEFTLLQLACFVSNQHLLKALLQLEPDMSGMDLNLRRLIHYAACSNDSENLKILKAKGCSLIEVDKVKSSALHYAA
jgi:hypothetical protein